MKSSLPKHAQVMEFNSGYWKRSGKAEGKMGHKQFVPTGGWPADLEDIAKVYNKAYKEGQMERLLEGCKDVMCI